MAGGLRRTAAALLVVLAAGVAFAPAAPARDVTALQATMTVGLKDNPIGGGFLSQNVGYIPKRSPEPSSFSVAGARTPLRLLPSVSKALLPTLYLHFLFLECVAP